MANAMAMDPYEWLADEILRTPFAKQRLSKNFEIAATNRCWRFAGPAGADKRTGDLEASLRERKQMASGSLPCEKADVAYVAREGRRRPNHHGPQADVPFGLKPERS